MLLVLQYHPAGWSLGSTRFHSPSVVICEVIRGTSWTLVIVSYLSPTTLAHLPDIDEALERFCGQDPKFMVDINIYFD